MQEFFCKGKEFEHVSVDLTEYGQKRCELRVLDMASKDVEGTVIPKRLGYNV